MLLFFRRILKDVAISLTVLVLAGLVWFNPALSEALAAPTGGTSVSPISPVASPGANQSSPGLPPVSSLPAQLPGLGWSVAIELSLCPAGSNAGSFVFVVTHPTATTAWVKVYQNDREVGAPAKVTSATSQAVALPGVATRVEVYEQVGNTATNLLLRAAATAEMQTPCVVPLGGKGVAMPGASVSGQPAPCATMPNQPASSSAVTCMATPSAASMPMAMTRQPGAQFEVEPAKVSSITAAGVTITWSSSQPGQGWMEYGVSKTALTGRTAVALNPALQYQAHVAGLKRQTKYYFRTVTVDGQGQEHDSPISSFTTKRFTFLWISW